MSNVQQWPKRDREWERSGRFTHAAYLINQHVSRMMTGTINSPVSRSRKEGHVARFSLVALQRHAAYYWPQA